jgi:hypothetical protein
VKASRRDTPPSSLPVEQLVWHRCWNCSGWGVVPVNTVGVVVTNVVCGVCKGEKGWYAPGDTK